MPELWEYIEKLVDAKRIVATKEVYDELVEHASEDLLAWLKKHRDMFSLSKQQVEKAGHLINEFYSQYKRGYKPEIGNGADPFVVALAMTEGAVVLTQESTQMLHNPSEVNEPKIPTVCYQYGVECVNIASFIEREGFKLALVREDGAAVKSLEKALKEPVATEL